ncbi:VWA domain-containing protein [candidate division KSB1 bacterium]|nr:VWA domain-containing protein [candidate division KSB1 bacterium]
MSFLNTAILLGLFAASIPIIIHLLTRSRTRTIPFSSLFFLKALEEKNLRRLKWRQILLLLVRTLIILFLVLAFARPALNTASSAFANAKKSAVIVLDNSFSMQLDSQKARTLFREAQNTAADILNTFQSGDQIVLMSLDDSSHNTRPLHQPDLARERLENMNVIYHQTNFSPILNNAIEQLSDLPNIHKELYVLSDFQKNAWQTIDSLQGKDIKKFAIPITRHHRNNIAITDMRRVTTILQAGKTAEIELTISNTTDQEQENRLVSLYMQNKRIAQNVIDVGAEQEIKHRFKINLTQTGWNSVRCELEDDELLVDNIRYLSFFVPAKQTVAVISDPGSNLRFLSLALEANAGNRSLIEWVSWTESEAETKSFENFDVIILYDLTRPGRKLIARLEQFLNNDKGLWVIAGPQVDIEEYNQNFNPIFSIPLFKARRVLNDAITLGKIDLSHPIFQGVFENNTDSIERPRVSFAIEMQPAAGSIPIIDYSTGEPFLLQIQKKQGKILVMTSSFQPPYNELVYRPLFAPLINRSINYLAIRDDQWDTDVDIGTYIRQRLSSPQLNAELHILRPDGNQDQVQPELQGEQAWIRYPFTDIPGFYALRDQNEIYKIWSVNIDGSESKSKMVSKDVIENKLNMQILERDNLLGRIREARYGQEFWKPLALLALLLLIVEMVLAYQKKEVKVKE